MMFKTKKVKTWPMKKKFSKDSFYQKSVSDDHPGRPCGEIFENCSSHSEVHNIIFSAA